MKADKTWLMLSDKRMEDTMGEWAMGHKYGLEGH
jgi:hypothetical protein